MNRMNPFSAATDQVKDAPDDLTNGKQSDAMTKQT
jgi:hypothetical protein